MAMTPDHAAEVSQQVSSELSPSISSQNSDTNVIVLHDGMYGLEADEYKDREEKDKCMYELQNAAWESRCLTQTLLRFDARRRPAIHTSLQEQEVEENEVVHDDLMDPETEFPGAAELSDILNATRYAVEDGPNPTGDDAAATDASDTHNSTLFCAVVFSHYYGPTKDDADKGKRIAIDGMGVIGRADPSDNDIPLSDVEVILEVGGDQTEQVRRAALHARACFAVRPYRSTVMVITLDAPTSNARYLFFHRAGLLSSAPMNLRTPYGWNDFVDHSSGLFSLGFETAGMLPTRSRRFIFLEACIAGEAGVQFVVLYVREVVLQRLSLRGRGILIEKLGILCFAGSRLAAISGLRSLLQKRQLPADLIDAPDPHEGCILSQAIFLPLRAGSTGNDSEFSTIDPTKEQLCRDLWVMKDSLSPNDVYPSMQNKFGLGHFLGSTSFEDTSRFMDEALQLKPWDILPEDDNQKTREMVRGIRVHTRTFWESQHVRPLVDAKSPREFVTAITHAMLGYFNLLHHRKILHCGINADSIFVIDEALRDPVSEIPTASALTKCQGVLLGAETCRQLGTHGRLSIDEDIDTDGLDLLDYTSMDIIRAKILKEPYERSSRHDFESAFWVMILEYLKIVHREKRDFEPAPSFALRRVLTATNPKELFNAKFDLAIWFDNPLVDLANQPAFGAFREFFTLWYISTRKHKSDSDGIKSEHSFSPGQFFGKILSYLDQAQNKTEWDSWEAFWAAGGGNNDLSLRLSDGLVES